MLVEPVVVTVTSETTPGVIYIVRLPDSDEGACTCPDYIHRRAHIPGATCKHMRKAAAWAAEQEGFTIWDGDSDSAFTWRAGDPILAP